MRQRCQYKAIRLAAGKHSASNLLLRYRYHVLPLRLRPDVLTDGYLWVQSKSKNRVPVRFYSVRVQNCRRDCFRASDELDLSQCHFGEHIEIFAIHLWLTQVCEQAHPRSNHLRVLLHYNIMFLRPSNLWRKGCLRFVQRFASVAKLTAGFSEIVQMANWLHIMRALVDWPCAVKP